MHEGLKPYVCSICNKSFTQKGNLRKHLRLHEVETIKQRKVFDCIYCPKSYTERYNLRSHLNRFHGVTDLSIAEVKEALDYRYSKITPKNKDK
mmetsp:Transcript_20382/g.22762  ORF Transcript_20382/g.22762 Transcript_20382/m.22762 type:complete len:93 (-) Transcript_20382:35-313(-)